jgi:rRNA maturation endonuclease Nob1
MIVAASGDEVEEAETYCLPLAPIFADIQEDFKAPVVVPAARDPEADEPHRFNLRAHQSWDPKFDVREDPRESSDDSTSSGSTESDIGEIQKVDGYGTDAFRPNKSTRLTVNATQAPEKIEKALGPQKLSEAASGNFSTTDISSEDINRGPDSERQPKNPVRSHTVEIEDGEEPKPSNKILENGDILSLVSDESRASDRVESPTTALNVPELGGPKASDMHVDHDPEDKASHPQDGLMNAETQLIPRTRTSELMGTARPIQGSEDYGRASSGPVVLRAREREGFEFVPRRRRSPSPELEEKLEREEIIVRRDETESPFYRERTREGEEIIIRRDESESPPYKGRYRRSDDIIIRRLRSESPPYKERPRPREPEEIIIRRHVSECPPSREESREREEIIIRRHRSVSPPLSERSREREEVTIPPDDRSRTRERPQVIIRRDERDTSRLRSVSSARYQTIVQHPKNDGQRARFKSDRTVYTIFSDEEADDLEDTLIGVIEEARRKADRRAKRPVRRSFSRRYIGPETLDQYGVKWRWESDDDWIIVKQDLTEERETELRAHTKRLQQGRGRTSRNHDIHGDGAFIQNDTNLKELMIERLEKERKEREDVEFEEKLRVRMSKAGRCYSSCIFDVAKDVKSGFSQNYIGDLTQTLQDREEEMEVAYCSDELAMKNACRQLDLQFESKVQDLLWEVGCPIDFCEQILKEHAHKEGGKDHYALGVPDPEHLPTSLTRQPRGVKTRARSTKSKPSPKEYERRQQPSKARENERRRPTAKKDPSPSMIELLTGRSKPLAALQP